MGERGEIQGLCRDTPPSHPRDSPEPGSNAHVRCAHTSARVEQSRKEKKAETIPPLGAVLLHPVGRIEHQRRQKTGPVPRPAGFIAPRQLPSDTGSSWSCLSLDASSIDLRGLGPQGCHGIQSCLHSATRSNGKSPGPRAPLGFHTVFSCLAFSFISCIRILLCHRHGCQPAHLSSVTSCRRTEHKSWKGPWKTFPSKHLRLGHASPPETGLCLGRSKAGEWRGLGVLILSTF